MSQTAVDVPVKDEWVDVVALANQLRAAMPAPHGPLPALTSRIVLASKGTRVFVAFGVEPIPESRDGELWDSVEKRVIQDEPAIWCRSYQGGTTHIHLADEA